MENKKVNILTKKNAEENFKETYELLLKANDIPAKRFAWNCYVDMICKDGSITQKKAAAWHQPKFVNQ